MIVAGGVFSFTRKDCRCPSLHRAFSVLMMGAGLWLVLQWGFLDFL